MLQTLLKILFPNPCAVCGFLEEALCSQCFHSLNLDLRTRHINGLKIVHCMSFNEDSLLQRLIHPFKYKHQADLFRYFVPFMREGLKVLTDLDAVLVPVPLHHSRLKERGYNQVELLVKWLSKDLGMEHCSLLERVRDTGHQAHLETRLERLNNMRAAFRVTQNLSTRHIILVDDIVTSGATLLACRDALRAAGMKNVSALTLANRE